MHLSFLKTQFSQYAVELHSKDDSEWAYIKNAAYNKALVDFGKRTCAF